MLFPLNLPPGMSNVGTDLQSAGRWIDGNFVRWREGSMRPIKGWRDFATLTETARGAINWSANDGTRWYAAGTYDGLYSITGAGTVADITPAGYTSGRETGEENRSYGGGYYGTGLYGVERPETGTFTPATTWDLDNFGQDLVACANTDGDIYEWGRTGVATVIANAPTSCLGVMVTDERFVFALGAGGNARKVQWCDQEDYDTWTPSATNQAGDILLETHGQIQQGLRTRGNALILTDADAHTATYVGQPFIYSFERVGERCGAVSRKAATAFPSGAAWMGYDQFFVFDGSSVQTIPCEVADFVFPEINRDQESLIFAVTNSLHDEIWWFFPSSSSIENDRYVAYNYREGFWVTGYLSRSTGVDRVTGRHPVLFEPGGEVYQHEIGEEYDGVLPYAESGPIKVDAGDQAFMVRRIIPDEETAGGVDLTLKARRYPNGAETEAGPYQASSPTSTRITGRQLRLKVQSRDGGDEESTWRFGVPRLDIAMRGRR